MFRTLDFFRIVFAGILLFGSNLSWTHDLEEVKKAGVLRHLGIPYANFVTGAGDGLDVELMQGFARHLGVNYQYVPTGWSRVFGDLNGRNAKRNKNNHAELLDEVPIKGDVISNGMTILGWRAEIVDFATPTFPSGVWLMARADSVLLPITPTGTQDEDIILVKSNLKGLSVLALESTCLDPGLYEMASTGADVRLLGKGRKLNEMAPAMLSGRAETTLLDVPDALIALEKWPGELKVIGPVSGAQEMAPAFRPGSPRLREAFNRYFSQIRQDGSYIDMVQEYYPAVFLYFPDFFRN